MSGIKKQLEICPPAYMCKGPNRENFVSTGHKCGYCKGNGRFRGTDTSLREMTLKEYSAAVAAMQKLVPPTYQEQLRKILRQKRSSVLHQMQLLGIDTADWDRVNAFCRDSRIAGKEFRELDCEALDTLQVKLRAIRRKRENKQQ